MPCGGRARAGGPSFTWSELAALVVSALRKKAARYGKTGCRTYDVLVYLNRKWLTPLDGSPPPSANDLQQLVEDGWRSVSVLWTPRAVVLHVSADAPTWLRAAVGQVRSEWVGDDGERLFGLFQV